MLNLRYQPSYLYRKGNQTLSQLPLLFCQPFALPWSYLEILPWGPYQVKYLI